MIDRFSDHARQLMAKARAVALELRHDFIAPEHLLLGMLQLPDCGGMDRLREQGVDTATLQEALRLVLPAGPAAPRSDQLPFTPAAKRVLEACIEHAARLGHAHIGSEHVLMALASVESTLVHDVLARLADTKQLLAQPAPAAGPHDRGRVRLLLISNSTMHGGGYLQHCAHEIRDLLGPRQKVLFVPYALHDHDGYAAKAAAAFAGFGHALVSVHTLGHAPAAVQDADAVFIGGGNTFRLLTALYHYGLLAAIRERALAGMPYIGSSAGTNVATLSIRTTNDMPIVQPPSFAALQLVPFQINPHYLDPDPGSTHMGETREERLRQFHEEHTTPVLGLREGCMLRVDGPRAELRGTTRARLFRRGETPVEYTPPCDLSFLLAD